MAPGRVRLAEADPDLVEGLDEVAASEARRSLIAPLRIVERGSWSPGAEQFGSQKFIGLLILRGLITRRVALADRSCTELLGEGDLLRPDLDDGEHAVAPFEAWFEVLERVEVAVLDGETADQICRWPEVMAVIVERAMMRARYLAGHLTLTQFTRVDERLLILFWHLAERWGRVGLHGVRLDLPVTHEVLAGVVAARRPSVTTAVGHLEDRGLISVPRRGVWLLHGKPHDLRANAAAEGA
ncbi:MAG: hypothetical protein AVDCRST_MAG45-2361 [uncultured Solirubrobacterales bacterium]|uniref:HTH crp-type domain-containing protein n=1 Tax=uncultured Solirubrobacterales bacterium TaxID=768556 RepID=A0A6J4TBK3_9ACTN|nr:MAG: hypothetical protein AVDCRST_MAG45-2361 [uncultured Solirubrobacterales bacterium]